MKIQVCIVSNQKLMVCCLAEDGRTELSPFVEVESLAVLRRLLRCAGANDSEMKAFEERIAKWSHSTCWISDLTPDSARLLCIDIKKMLSGGVAR